MMTAQEGERRAWGFDYKTQQATNAVDDAELRRRNQLIDSIREFASKMAQIPAPPGSAPTSSLKPPSQPPRIDGEVA
jgi:hypothetical protein